MSPPAVRVVVCTFAVLLSLSSYPQPTTAPTTAPANSTPRATLDALDRKELGPRYDPARADTYFETHKLLETYFTSTSTTTRKACTQSITATALDPNIVGRLARIHMNWQPLSPGSHFINERVGPRDVKYYLGVPKTYDLSTATPLVIMLPSPTAFPSDPKPDPEAIARLYTTWINAELTKHPNALVLMPLLDPREGYGPSYTGMSDVIGAMQHATTIANIDPTRVSLVGLDASAPAVWNLGLHYSTYFASIAPFAGIANSEWQRMRLMNLRNTHIITWHDQEDTVVKVDTTRQLTDILKRMKFAVDYAETKGIGHLPNDAVLERAYEKLFTHPRPLYPAEVNLQSNRPDTMFNRVDWLQLYQASRPGPDHRVLFRTGYMTLMSNPMSIKAKLADNHIEADPDNVESMRFYFNDQMIDFSKPVTITLNHRVKFQGILTPSIDEMLKDQLFLGRGWRYYTAVVDIDLGEPATKPTTHPN